MEPKVFLNHTAHNLLGVRETKGNLFGIELELEGRGVGLRDVATKGWQRHEDGSLRGESVEFTTSGGKSLDESKKLVEGLFDKFKEQKVKFNDSVRTSTHVHLNFADKSIKQAINFFCLFTLFEEVLQYYSGEDRKGNLFCISSRDAEGVINVLANSIAKGSLDRFAGDAYKYAACNLSTLYKFGTIEVRTMRGANSAELVNKWLDILNDMYEYSLKMESPAILVNNLSFLGADGLMKSIFKSENMKELLKTFPAIKTLHNSLMDGARLIQLFAYEFDEEFKAKVEIKEIVGDRLPVILAIGAFAGNHYCIYRPDGNRWNCSPYRGARRGPIQFWEDGMRVSDDRRIQWDQERQRFIVRYPNGDIYECNWRLHHEIRDEGPGLIREMPPPNWWEDDLALIPEPEWEDDHDEEGDDF